MDYRDLLDELLDAAYDRAMRPLVRAVTNDTAPSGDIGRALADILKEAERLEKQGQALTANHPDVLRLATVVDDAGLRYTRELALAAIELEETAIDAAGQWMQQAAFLGMSDDEIARIGISFNRPNPRAILEAIDVVQSDAWRADLGAYADSISGDALVRGIVFGQNARKTAADLTNAVLGPFIPGTEMRRNRFLAEASRRAHTLQMYSFRRADAINQTQNRDIIDKVIRIAALDNRVCFACLALHGSELRPGEVVQDHDRGRCTSVIIPKGLPRTIQTGQDWLNGLLDQERRGTISAADLRILNLMREQQGASMRALEDGAATLNDFIGYYFTDLWGQQPHQKSLISILGAGAEQYYAWNQP